LQYALDEEFGGDIEKLLEDIQKFAIESEEYEVAASIRDALNKEK
jgi:protein-arginine kinase activator protein McsA